MSILDYSYVLTPNIADKKIEKVGLFPKGHVSLVAGEPGVGKTWFMLNIARAVADGTNGFGLPMPKDTYKRGRVLIFAGETGVKLLADRMRLLGGCKNLESIRVLSSQALMSQDIDVMINTAIGRKNIAEAVDLFKPDVVFFDTMISFMSGDKDESSQVDMTDPIRGLSYLANKYNSAMVMLHHFRKRTKSSDKSNRDLNEVIGSSAFIRLASLVIGLERVKDVRMVKCLKSWWEEFLPFSFKIVKDGDGLNLDVNYDYDSDGHVSVVNTFQRAKDFIFSTYKEDDIFSSAQVISDSGMGRNTVMTIISAMLTNGEIFIDHKDGRTPFYTRKKPIL